MSGRLLILWMVKQHRVYRLASERVKLAFQDGLSRYGPENKHKVENINIKAASSKCGLQLGCSDSFRGGELDRLGIINAPVLAVLLMGTSR